MKPNTKRRPLFALLATVLPFLLILSACGSCNSHLDEVNYTPRPGGDWKVSTPGEQQLDSTLLAKLYANANKVETLHALLVTKNGFLVAEGYFNGGSEDQENRIQSVTKSYTSALVGIALQQGYIESLDQKMTAFFPELADRISDLRKNQITIRHMLQMRAGYPWEESTKQLFELLYSGFRPSNLVDVPLVSNPGTDFEYSNLTSHLLGVIVARAADTDLKSFAETHLFEPLGVDPSEWQTFAMDRVFRRLAATANDPDFDDPSRVSIRVFLDGWKAGDPLWLVEMAKYANQAAGLDRIPGTDPIRDEYERYRRTQGP